MGGVGARTYRCHKCPACRLESIAIAQAQRIAALEAALWSVKDNAGHHLTLALTREIDAALAGEARASRDTTGAGVYEDRIHAEERGRAARTVRVAGEACNHPSLTGLSCVRCGPGGEP